ncbi:PDZ domain-containing protein [Lacibacter luteus]|uniref:PDZ domain-containing protein n=1 Tax=Lacibacter luteus TaxID=2508719 RepID=A0A4Q1CIF9_9BACT|nr:PDZ domain-containing protein [Lacibacter luteus]RXK59849.1 PDZ domain-containing protein [Lacibacter luteus]
MKRISLYAMALVAATQLLAVAASAQDKVEKKEKRVKEEKKEQIIIRKKGDKTEKTTIVIEGDKVTVNGKPVEKGDKDVIIQRFDDDMLMLRSPKLRVSPPRVYHRYNGAQNWELFNSDQFKHDFKINWKSGALLGVVSNDHAKGAELETVQKESAAEKAGLQKGDIITKVGDKKITSQSDLSTAIRAQKPNDEVEISYIRDGKEKNVKVKLGEGKGPEGMHEFKMEMPEFKEFNPGQFHLQIPRFEGMNENVFMYRTGRPQLGITIQDTEEGNGVKILEVDADSPAAKSGLQKDDVITEVDGKAVKTVGETREALRGKPEQNLWNVKLLRGGKTVNVEVKIPKKLQKADL